MKSYKSYSAFIFAVILLFLAGCEDDNPLSPEDKRIHGSGALVSRTPNIAKTFNAVKLLGQGNIFIEQGDEHIVMVEADDNITDSVKVFVDGGFLNIDLAKAEYVDITINVYITLPSIKKNVIEGVGNIKCAVTADSIRNIINGVGNITLRGKANFVCGTINGAGNINAKEFPALSGLAAVNGAGNITMNVSERFEAYLNGAGNIYYYGNPGWTFTLVRGDGVIQPGG